MLQIIARTVQRILNFRYGLVMPKKQQTAAPSIRNVFGDDDGSDEDDGSDWVRKALKAEGEKHKVKKQTKLNMQKALKEDPTIYQYDEVYDDMEQTRNQTKAAKQENKKPKYIQNLLKAAERRKKEQEHRIERMVQKEREAEGDMYADKESFVTSAYRAKLEEFKKLEQEEARMSRLEAIGDVTKQQDLSGFYRHLYEQTVDDPSQGKNNDKNDKTKAGKEDDKLKESLSESGTTSGTTNKEISSQSKENSIPTRIKKSRQYRQRVIEADCSDSETDIAPMPQAEDTSHCSVKNKNQAKPDLEEPEVKKQKQDSEQKDNPNTKSEQQSNQPVTEVTNKEEAEKPSDNTNNDTNEQEDKIDAKEKLEQARKERSRIWEKRTVGPVFEAALQRYYERKAMRLSAA